MARKKYAQLVRIENNRKITVEAEAEFLHTLQHGLLLALWKEGILDLMQYRQAEQMLKAQYCGKKSAGEGTGQ